MTTADYMIWQANYGAMGGNKNLKFDFDRDGIVAGTDTLTWQRNLGMTDCASRFEGDADGDGDVDQADNPWGQGSVIDNPCLGGGGQLAAGLADSEEADFSAEDMDSDGDIDSEDAALWVESVGGTPIAAE